MSINADLGEVARFNAAFAEFATARGVPTEVRRSMLVVLDELLANIVSYGLAKRADGEATVDVSLDQNTLVVTLSDNGVPFDPLGRAAPDTSLSVEERPIGGLGIHLVRQMVDEVTYERRENRNVTVLLKRLSNGTAASARDERGGE